MDDIEDINPELWTQKELLKHVYRELLVVKSDVSQIHETISNDTRHQELQKEIDHLRKDFDVDKGKRAGAMWAFGALTTAITIIINFFVDE